MGEHKQGVPARAKKHKQQNLIFGIVGVVAIIALIAVVIIFGSNSSNDKPEVTTSPTETTTTIEPAVITPAKIGEVNEDGGETIFDIDIEHDEFYIGDIVEYGSAKIVFARGEDVSVAAEADKDAYRLVTVEFAVENIGESELDISFYNFQGYVGDTPVSMAYGEGDFLDAKLSPGRFVTGCLYFEVPVDMTKLEIQYSDNNQSDEAPVITFIYDGLTDSGYKGQTEITTSENALSVDSVIDLNNRRITYVGCSEYISEDEEIQPHEGYRFISLEFKVENIAESGKEDITSWDFSCYADNMPCKTVHIRDNDLEGLLRAGETMTGTVTFEVPVDAKIIEADYLYNYRPRMWQIFSVELPSE